MNDSTSKEAAKLIAKDAGEAREAAVHGYRIDELEARLDRLEQFIAGALGRRVDA